MIRLNVFIQVNESNRNAVLETAKELVAQSLNDKGCIAYDIFESATRKDVLMICETWKDAESLDAHEKAAHFITLVPKLQELGKMKLEKFAINTERCSLRMLRNLWELHTTENRPEALEIILQYRIMVIK